MGGHWRGTARPRASTLADLYAPRRDTAPCAYPAFAARPLPQIDTPARIGFFNLTFSPRFGPGQHNAAAAPAVVQVELTCTDGIVCNGMERLVARRRRTGDRDGAGATARGLVYECAPAARALCDDGIACTIDACVENGVCQHTPDPAYNATECPTCVCTPACAGLACGDDTCGGTCGTCGAGTACSQDQTSCVACTPSCTGAVCGDDGCGGSCGTCAGTDVCAGGACVPPLDVGTCANPISLTAAAVAAGWNGTLFLSGDNRLGINEVRSESWRFVVRSWVVRTHAPAVA